MTQRASRWVPRWVSGFTVAVVVAAFAVAGATTPANAQELGTQVRPEDAAAEAAVRAALERDLGMSGAELDAYLAASAEATELDAQLQEQLGARYAGSWFDEEAGSLTVAVTSSEAAGLAQSAGAETVRVSRSERELTAISEEVAELVESDSAARADVFWWGIDPASNQVTITVRDGAAAAVDSLTAEYGDAVAVEETAVAPQTAQQLPWLDGGIRYDNLATGGWCSTGFNVRNVSTGVRYVLTAGHCGVSGNQTAHAGIAIGPFHVSFFPGPDDALIRVTNTGYWNQGPFVWSYSGFVTVSGFTDAPVNTPICKSGARTGWTCGRITAKNQSVNYFDTNGNFIGTVNQLTRHNACVRQGDSGGSNLNTSSSPYRAEGVSSGAQLHGAALQCGQNASPPVANVSWYYPIADSLSYYGAVYGVTLW